ncbi:uncharacterized protein VTP21DRAFT_3187 [Calcarisporiella thermophila]|uniref:uncharacterized protein n=1 Tax=Calcarisporiella thermophila TaxID=911321 RepID=UPI0037441B05
MSLLQLHARQIFDSRGNPTVEVEAVTRKGVFRAAVPSGASTGTHEALELRDGIKSEYNGKGVSKVINNIKDIIAPALIKAKLDLTNQSSVDDFLLKLDGTKNKCKLGANALLGVSLAVCKAGAAEKGIPLYAHIASLVGSKEPYVLPVPAFNVINGGEHAGNKLAFQEFMIMPTGAKSFAEAMKIGTECYHSLKSVIKEKYGMDAMNVGDEGGFAPNMNNVHEALELLRVAISKAGHTDKVKIAFDAAASEFYKNGKYNLDYKDEASNSSNIKDKDGLFELYEELISEYPIVSIEDPFDQEDWEAWVQFRATVDIQLVADDLTVTNPERIQKAVDINAANGLLLKLNQIGTMSESLRAAELSKQAGWGIMVSHRSGDTEDTTIADLVVGLRAGQIKAGAPCRSERLAKFNQLLRIEEELGDQAVYAGNYFQNAYSM